MHSSGPGHTTWTPCVDNHWQQAFGKAELRPRHVMQHGGPASGRPTSQGWTVPRDPAGAEPFDPASSNWHRAAPGIFAHLSYFFHILLAVCPERAARGLLRPYRSLQHQLARSFAASPLAATKPPEQSSSGAALGTTGSVFPIY